MAAVSQPAGGQPTGLALLAGIEAGQVQMPPRLAGLSRRLSRCRLMRRQICGRLALLDYSVGALNRRFPIRGRGFASFDDLLKVISDMNDLFSPDECWNIYKHARHLSG